MILHSRLLAALFTATVLLSACEEQKTAPLQPPPTQVTVVTLKSEAVTLTRELPGRTNAFAVAEVRPQVTGIVKERLFTEGSEVAAGQPLYQLDDATYRAAHNSARALLARAQAAQEIARLNANRARELIKTNAMSKQDYDTALATELQAAADVGVAEAQVASTAVQLAYARIASPIDGRIGRSAVTQGALVTADQDAPLATIQQLDPIYVDLTRSASELLELRRQLAQGAVRQADGIPVSIVLEDGTQYQQQGKLMFSEVSVDPMTGSYALRVLVPNPDHLLMPGMYVRALLSNAVLEQGLLVPQKGISRDLKGDAVAMVVTGQGTVEERRVAVSRTIGDRWLVDSGLAAGDRVIVEGLQKIAPGMTVVASEATAAPAVSASGTVDVSRQ
jgi:membrane fusion protein (multidrug efflux system)